MQQKNNEVTQKIMTQMVQMMEQSKGNVSIKEFNKTIAKYQVMNEANQDMQKEFNEGFEGMDNNEESADDLIRDLQLRVQSGGQGG